MALVNFFPFSQVTIGRLSDEVLLSIFRYYLDSSPRFWPRLVHICSRWRRIVFASQQSLRLRLFCTHKTPVLKTLDCWPALPIVVHYGGFPNLDPPAPEDEGNIMAALKQSHRVSSIRLTVTRSLLEKLSAIERPFSELEVLVLVSASDYGCPTLPSAFRWGTRLRTLHLTRIAIPAPLQPLSPSTGLVDLQLDETPGFSPDEFVNALSGMTQLRSLSLHIPYTPNFHRLTPGSVGRVVFPVLMRLKFRGSSRYLEDLVARIDGPRLEDIEVTFLDSNNFTFDRNLSQLSDFIDQIEIHKSYRRAHILSSESAISISLTQPGAATSLKLEALCGSLGVQLTSIARICTHLSAFLFNVEDLRISTTRSPIWTDTFDNRLWLGPINSFTGVKWFHLDGDDSTNILWAFQPLDQRRETVLPALHKLYVPGLRHAPLTESVMSFITSRWISGHPIAVGYERLSELRGIGTYTQ